MKKQGIVIIIIIGVLVCAVLATIFLMTGIPKEESALVSSTSSNIETPVVNTLLSEEERLEVAEEIKQTFENKTDKTVLKVNGEEISEKEIAYIDFQKNNQYVNKDGEKINAVDEAIKQYVILQDAEKNNITLTEEQEKDIKTRIEKSIQNSTEEETEALLDAINMNQEEFIEFSVDRERKLEIISKWIVEIMIKIDNGEIEINDEEFNNKYSEYIKSNKTTSLLDLVDIYENYLIEQATVEYIN